MSIATLKKKTAAKYNNSSVNQRQFALNGTHRNQGFIGQTSFSRTNMVTPASGVSFQGYGSCCGLYKISELKTTSINSTEDSTVVKPSVLSTKGMLQKKTMWARRSYPFSSTKPGDSLNLSSGGDYITFKRQKTIQSMSNKSISSCPHTPDKETNECNIVKTIEQTGIALSQGEYLLRLTGQCGELDISYVLYSQSLSSSTSGRPIPTC